MDARATVRVYKLCVCSMKLKQWQTNKQLDKLYLPKFYIVRVQRKKGHESMSAGQVITLS